MHCRYVAFKGELEYHLMTAPINWVRYWLRSLGHRAAVTRAARRRQHMQGAENVDMEMHHQLKRRLGDEKRRQLLMVQSGVVWTASTLHKAGYLLNDLCVWCGKAAETLFHLWWECPEHEQMREEVRKLLPDGPCGLPECMAQYGMPVEPSADLRDPYGPM